MGVIKTNRRIKVSLVAILLTVTVTPLYSISGEQTFFHEKIDFQDSEHTRTFNRGKVYNNDTGEQFDSIQEAIDDEDTLDGHTIFVESGIYEEHVRITKSVHLIGRNRENTIIDAGGYGTIITVEKDNVSIRNFKLINGGRDFYDAGVLIRNSDNITLENLYIGTVHQGVFLERSSGAIIHNVECMDNRGIYIYGEKKNHYLHDIENVTVNEKPLCYLKNQDNALIPDNCAGVILVNCRNTQVRGVDIGGISVGVEIAYSTNITVTGSIFSNNDFGIDILNSNGCIIEGCSISNNMYTGLSVENCNNIAIARGNIISSNKDYGIYIYRSTGCTVTDNQVKDNEKSGLYILESTNLHIKQNALINNGLIIKGKNLEHFLHVIDGNTINDRKILYYKNTYGPHPNPAEAGVVIFVNCTKGTIEGFHPVQGCTVGFESAFCTDTEIFDSTFSNNHYGIYSYSSTGETIENCVFTGCEVGIYLKNCSKITIRNNREINNNENGIKLEYSRNCNIFNNSLTSNRDTGIYIEESPENCIWKNTLERNTNGMKIQYASNNCLIHNNSMTGTGWEEIIGGYGGDGLYMKKSNGCIISDNQIEAFYGEGIWLEDGENNIIKRNAIRYNRGNGIQLVNASNNIITENYINYNWWGIRLDENSNGNRIWRNIFWFNYGRVGINLPSGGGNACDDGNNIWNGTYSDWSGEIIGGNRWSNLRRCRDYYKGPNQDEPGIDGVCDHNYSIPSCSDINTNNVDEYPLCASCIFLPDETPPNCEIVYPEPGYLYWRGVKVMKLPSPNSTVVIGDIDIAVYAKDPLTNNFASSMVKVDFYTENRLQGRRLEGTDEHLDYHYEAHLEKWRYPHCGCYVLVVKATDMCNNSAEDSMILWIFNT